MDKGDPSNEDGTDNDSVQGSSGSEQSRKRKSSPSSAQADQSAVPSKASKLRGGNESPKGGHRFIGAASNIKSLATSEERETSQIQSKRKRSLDVIDQQSPTDEAKLVVEKSELEKGETPLKKAKLSEQDEPNEAKQSFGTTNLDTSSDGNTSSISVKPKRNTSTSKLGNERSKPTRKRTKFLLQAVLEQMEFYFSDSNLSKDRYVKHLLDQNEDGYIDLSVFGNFNKLQALHKDGVSSKVLAKALQRSKILQLSGDKTQVRRITPFKEISQEETDRRTIYVENLPSRATHTWIRSLFSQCGKVVYVSLPVYRTTREKKGFAFVEFDTPEEAAKACLLNNPPPEKAQEKPGKFPKSNKTLNRLQKIVPEKPEQDSNEENFSDDQKKQSVNPTSTEKPKKKKKKKGKKKKPSESVSEEKPDTANAPLPASETSEVKKKKKKKKKKRPSLSQDTNTGQDKTDVKPDEQSKEGEVQPCVQTESSQCETIMSDDKQKPTDAPKMEAEPANEELVERKKKRRKKKKKSESTQEGKKGEVHEIQFANVSKTKKTTEDDVLLKSEEVVSENAPVAEKSSAEEVTLCRKERKRLRQEDIRRKKMEREEKEQLENMESVELKSVKARERLRSDISLSSQYTDSESEDPARILLKRDGSQVTSILKSKKKAVPKRVEFDLVPETKEFIRGKEVRKRKKLKKEKLHLRIISKKEWDTLRAEYINQQKSHMTALKESLRELRQQENAGKPEPKGPRHLDLEDVFGTKRLKPSRDIKMAHVEALKFIPNVIVQWRCTHEMHRDKIRGMFKSLGSGIAYIDAEEEAKSGYIRFTDEESAERFTKLTLTQCSSSFSARVLPAEKQQAYWDKANEDRMKRLGRKRKEKGSEKLARKVFERNKATFFKKPSRIVFSDGDDDVNDEEKKDEDDDNDEVKKEGDDDKKEEEDVKEKDQSESVKEDSAKALEDQNLSTEAAVQEEGAS
ncbi:la-related protein 7 [Aplysia californica]|uniref:La-related protein 7 n=1 Tax=Aplysia californica TaxID=6500 RepID=A0ABM0JTU0_APLCA|nr:la-related protein 7 [Aplysia californica]